MESATQSAILEPSEGEVGAAMRAVAVDQAVAAFLVAKQNEVLAEQFDRAHRPRSLQFVDQCRRLPIHPHQFSAGVLSPGAGDQVVRFLAHHEAVLSAAVRLLNEWANYDISGWRGKPNL